MTIKKVMSGEFIGNDIQFISVIAILNHKFKVIPKYKITPNDMHHFSFEIKFPKQFDSCMMYMRDLLININKTDLKLNKRLNYSFVDETSSMVGTAIV